MEPSTLLNRPNFAVNVGSGGCVSDGGQKSEKGEESWDAPVLNLQLGISPKLINNEDKKYIFHF